MLLSLVAIRHLKKALIACLFALIGALLGGMIMFHIGMYYPESAVQFLDRLPSISPDMLARVKHDMEKMNLLAVMQGPLLGTPYKIYAVQASNAGIDFLPFMLISIPARLIRFILVVLLVWWIASKLPASLSDKQRLYIAYTGWSLFYLLYFSIMPN
ncbi:MAG: hypothetical protein Q9M14_02645 [Mariprofundaceae bacterium]|nr:hypothetical protein [Mariprofundaceae bacterium]